MDNDDGLFMVWLGNRNALVLFPARASYRRHSSSQTLTCLEQDLNMWRTRPHREVRNDNRNTMKICSA